MDTLPIEINDYYRYLVNIINVNSIITNAKRATVDQYKFAQFLCEQGAIINDTTIMCAVEIGDISMLQYIYRALL